MKKEKVINITKMFCALFVVIAIVYDVWSMAMAGTEGSISHTLIVWSYDYPIMTFACGVLMGHLFWRVRGTDIIKKKEDATRE